MRVQTQLRTLWNSSLFHYRGIGVDYGDVLVGIQGASNDRDVLESFLLDVGFRFQYESENPAYRLFL